MGGSFPVDLVLFGMIAAFVILRLRGVLGRRTGFERPAQVGPRPAPRTIDGTAEPSPAPPARPVPEPASALGQTLTRMAGIDRGFRPETFLDGAEKAFRIIVAAFAVGDRAGLRPLLGTEMFAAFDAAITAREQASETMRTEIRSIRSATIEEAGLTGSHASVTVHLISDQVSLVTARDGTVASGTDAVTEIGDVWTFERDLGARDPTWHLTAARSA